LKELITEFAIARYIANDVLHTKIAV